MSRKKREPGKVAGDPIFHFHFLAKGPQPRWGCLLLVSFPRVARCSLGFDTESLWDSRPVTVPCGRDKIVSEQNWCPRNFLSCGGRQARAAKAAGSTVYSDIRESNCSLAWP